MNYKARTRSINERTLRSKQLLAKGESGTFGAVVAPSPEAVRAAIVAQTCPFCGRGPYKVLAVHTNKTHGVDKRELREMAGLTLGVSICSEGYSARARELASGRAFDGAAIGANRKKQPREWTSAGKVKVTENLVRWNETPESAATRSVAGQAGGRARAERYAANRIAFVCPVCGKDFALPPSTARKTVSTPACSKKCRSESLRTDHCVNGHARTPENTRLRPRPGGGTRRDCKVCHRESAARRQRDGEMS
jgi:predicted RNA-binding Zn-ribbon protein involved in translation (DUF1610 family)